MDGSKKKPIEILVSSPMKEVLVCSNTKGSKKLHIAHRKCAPANQSVVKQITDFINKNAVGKIDKNHYFFLFWSIHLNIMVG